MHISGKTSTGPQRRPKAHAGYALQIVLLILLCRDI